MEKDIQLLNIKKEMIQNEIPEIYINFHQMKMSIEDWESSITALQFNIAQIELEIKVHHIS